MKRLFRKDNPISRLIALWVVFILALTPLMEQGPFKGGTKAAAGTWEFTLDVSESKTVTLTDSKYTIEGAVTPRVMTYWDATLKKGANITGNIDVTLSFNGNLVRCVTGVKVYDAGDDVEPTLAKNISLDLPSTAQTVNDGQKYAVYVKVADAKLTEGDPIWCLLAVYELKPVLIGNIYWVDSAGNAINTSGAFTDACVPNVFPVEEGNVFLGDIKYEVAKGYNVNYSEYTGKLETVTPGTSVLNTAAYMDAGNGGDGNYVFFLSYNDDSGDEAISPKGHSIEIDKTAPAIIPAWTKINDQQVDSNEVLYLDANKDNSLSFKVTEDYPAENITVNFYNGTDKKTKEVSKNGGVTFRQQAYYSNSFLPSGLTENLVYDVKLVLKDSLGNVEVDAEGNPVELQIAKICPINPDLTITVTGENSSAITVPNYSEEKLKIKVKVTSADKIASISLYDGTTKLDGYDKIFNTDTMTKTNGLYVVENQEFTIPDGDLNASFTDLKIVATEVQIGGVAETEEYTLGGFEYDDTDPEVVVKGIYVNSYGSWTKISPAGASNTYYIDENGTENYRIFFDVKNDNAPFDSTKSKLMIGSTEIKEFEKTNGNKIISSENTDYTEYYAELSTSDIKNHIDSNGETAKVITYKAKFFDAAGNYKEVSVSPEMAIPNNEIAIETVVKDKNDKPISWDDFTNFKDTHYLYVTASSGYPIESITFSADKYTEVKIEYTEQDGQQHYSEDYRRYIVTEKIALPQIADNHIIASGKVTVVDRMTPTAQTKTETIKELYYDATKPYLRDITGKSETDTLAAFKEDLAWYQIEDNLCIDGKVYPGDQTNETNIESFSYTISNSLSDVTQDLGNSTRTGNIKIPESKTADGTIVTFSAEDTAGNKLEENDGLGETYIVKRRVDGTKPQIKGLTIDNKSGNNLKVDDEIIIATKVWDNLSLEKVDVDIECKTNGVYVPYNSGINSRVYDSSDALYIDVDEANPGVIEEVKHQIKLPDGEYRIIVNAMDKAGYVADTLNLEFEVDGTAPEVTAKVSKGTMGGKYPGVQWDNTPCDYYYSSDVELRFTCSDKNGATPVVKDNGSEIKPNWSDSENGVRVGTYTIKNDGKHKITINAIDGTENQSATKTIEFIKDGVNPSININANGMPAGSNTVYTNNVNLSMTVLDANDDPNDFYYKLVKNVPGHTTMVGDEIKTTNRTFTYSDEGQYSVAVRTRDKAGRWSAPRTVDFIIDKTAPNITVGGISSGGTSTSAINVSFNMQELFWEGASGHVTIYRQAGDGHREELFEEIDYRPTGINTTISRAFGESGIYRIEFTARDNAGHTAETSHTFTIDTEAPVVKLEGVDNYDVTSDSVSITATVSDVFYATKKVRVTGTVTDINGKVSPLSITDFNQSANPTTIEQTFNEDGIYDLVISSDDVAGNSHSVSVHFTIDKTAPTIGDLSEYEDKILTSFEWNKDLDELVSDLTVCDVQMYLNGTEYNGESAVQDGSYVLLITAEDELGQKTEKEVSFILDTKAPVFIVTGVEDKDKKLEPYDITVTVQLEEDELKSVTLNGETKKVIDNVATFQVTEVGEYKLYMEAVDAANNKATAEYEFELVSETEFNMWIIVSIVASIILVAAIIVVAKKKAKN